MNRIGLMLLYRYFRLLRAIALLPPILAFTASAEHASAGGYCLYHSGDSGKTKCSRWSSLSTSRVAPLWIVDTQWIQIGYRILECATNCTNPAAGNVGGTVEAGPEAREKSS